jgi:hypothetical protein
MAASSAPLLTIPVMEKIEIFVEDIPADVLAFHGGAEKLTKMLSDLIFPRTVDVSEQPKKRGRPAGSKNKPKDVAPPTQVTDTPKKRGRPAGSKNKPKDVAPATAVVTDSPKKRGRPAGSKNKPKPADTPTKPSRSPPKHTRKSKKSTAAATAIQRAWRASRPNHPITGNRCVYGCCKKQGVDFLGSLVRDTAPATEVAATPKKRGRPAGSKNKPKTPDAPVKRHRKPSQHTRKSKKSTAAATLIQQAWRASK